MTTARRTDRFKTPSALTDDYEIATQMDWKGAHDLLIESASVHPYKFVRIQKDSPERLWPSVIRKRMGVKDIDIYQCEHERSPWGDMPPAHLRVNEIPAKRNLVRADRQKKRSGEKARWDTWMRLTPPATLTRQQQRVVDEYEKRQRGLEEEAQRVRERNAHPLTEDELTQLDIKSMARPARLKAEAELELKRLSELVESRADARERAYQREIEEPIAEEMARAIAIETHKRRMAQGNPIKRRNK